MAGALTAPAARADLGDDLARLRRGLAGQVRVGSLGFRLLERGEVAPLLLPPWAVDATTGDCTTLVLLAPAPTQFLVHVHPWPGLQSVFAASAGAFQLTRCGAERASLLQVRIELRSPRAVVHGLVAVGTEPPLALPHVLPERDAGAIAPLGDPGPEPRREPLAARLARFESAASLAGATGVENVLLPSPGYVRLALAPGCHRFLATGAEGAAPFTLLLGEGDDANVERLPASEQGDVSHELCSATTRKLSVSAEGATADAERRLGVAHFSLPVGLPGRFGPEVAEQLLDALGQSRAPRRLGSLVVTALGAQGRTPLPRALLPQTCYLAALAVVHGRAQALTLAARSGAVSAEASSRDTDPSARVTFCTGRSGAVDLDVEARGLGVAWQLFVFQMGPARPEAG
ncbi:MAG: hypothetical protein EOO73_09670 [Myxococcales bacterium]|nr:MAG: hypothetical protein EOO73_09670 [Myxococcales bacterium]